ncbi:gibberellin 20-oxidase-like protein [Mercurialis annua]|uniref:gibberellin 20-oxidase-like protein n=1 Tax=Mercurialis annua TaxID=3986 RepID=UPI002160E331|nr:gibberellin 20-oxidase-like protein [Mercurialis annua]
MSGCLELPIFDISKPLSQSALCSLAEACKEWGFFNIANHGISKHLYSKIYSLSQDIFSLPSQTKLQLGPSSSLKTYTPRFIASPFFESLRVSGPDFLASAQNSADALFANQNSEFSEVLQEYGIRMTELSKKIIEILILSLGDVLDKKAKFYESEFSNCHGYLRIINYTPPEIVTDTVEGLGMHTDMSCVTIVYQDQIGGLQVKSRDGKWMDINPCEESLIVNIGDLLQAWSNEKFRSSEHRVVLRNSVNRLSLAFFWCFEDRKVISAPEEVVGEGNVRIYEPFVCSDYLRFRESSERGKFEKVGFTVRDFAGLNL